MAAEHITDLATDHYLEFLATGVVLLDADLHIQALNLSAENLLEVSASRALGSALEELLDESNEWYPLLHQAIAENYPMVRRAIPLTTRTGQERTVDITLSPIAGKVKSGCLLVELNMVDRLQAISRDESEWQAQATLKEIMKGVAHEVKNPLGGIRGAAQLLAGELGNPDLQEYTDIIISEVDRLHTLVDRMLGPRERMESEPTNIHEITEHVRQLIEAEAKGGLEIERDYDPSLPDFSADGGQLTQAVLNLVRNAWQACGEEAKFHSEPACSDNLPLAVVATSWFARCRSSTTGPAYPKNCCPGCFCQWSPVMPREPGWAYRLRSALPISMAG